MGGGGGWVPFLLEDAPEKFRVAQNVASPEAAGFDEHAAEPFEAVVGHPLGGAGEFARNVIKDSPTSHGNRDVDVVPVLAEPLFLEGHPEADDEDVGLGGVDVVEHGRVFRTPLCFIKIPIPHTHKAQVGVFGAEFFGRFFRHPRLGTEEEEGKIVLLTQGGQIPRKIGPCHAGGGGVAEDFGAEAHACAVKADDVGAVEEVAQPVVFVGEVEGVDVAREDEGFVALGDVLAYLGQQGGVVVQGERDTQEVESVGLVHSHITLSRGCCQPTKAEAWGKWGSLAHSAKAARAPGRPWESW